MKENWVIGIDEVGRGPLAGPVVVCAFALSREVRRQLSNVSCLPPLRDSKKLSALQREAWFKWIKNQDDIFFAVTRVTPKIIDRINIREATNLAATRAVLKLITKSKLQGSAEKIKVLLDGGIYLNKNKLPAICSTLFAKTIIGGDDTILTIQLASIVAKVARDKYMCKLHKKFPEYGFDQHKGYGTRMHYAALRTHGLSVVHRKSFLRRFA